MLKRIFFKLLVFVILFIIHNSGFIAFSYAQTTIVVGPGGGASAINTAISSAAVGSTIQVKAGTYTGIVTINKQVTVESFGDGPVWIDAGCVSTYPADADNGVDSGITITASNVVVRGIGVRNSRDAAILMDGRSSTVANVTIDNNTLENFDCKNTGPEYRAGVGMWYAGSGHRIINNIIDRRPGSSTAGNSNGIWTKSDTADPSGGGHYIAGNIIRHVYDGIGGEKEDDARGGYDRNTTIENNTIDYCNDDGISVEGGTKNITVRNNTISHCAIGIANAPNLIGPVYFQNNRITLGVPGEYGNVQCYKVGNFQPSLIPANEVGVENGRAYYTGNICDLSTLPDQDSTGWGQTNSPTSSIIADGNQTNVTRWVIEIPNRVTNHTYTFNNNCMYSSDSTGRFVEFINVIRNPDDVVAVNAMNATSWAEGNTASVNCAKGSITPIPTTPTLTPTRTPTPQPGTPTSTPTTTTPSPTSGIPSGTQTITFNDRPQNSALNGVYPTGLVNWASSTWFVSGPSPEFTTNYLTFQSASTSQATFQFIQPGILKSIDLLNGDSSGPATVTVTCSTTQTKQVNVPASSSLTLTTGWTQTCSSITLKSTRGTNRDAGFDNLAVMFPTNSKLGDVDGNGVVDLFDFNELIAHFGEIGQNIPSDLDGSGEVGIEDFNEVVANFSP